MIHNLRFSVCLLYPCKQRGGGGAILESQCLSIHLSCCLSVELIFWASSTDLGGTCLRLNSLETCWFWLRKIKEILINIYWMCKIWGIQFCSNLYTVHFFPFFKIYVIHHLQYVTGIGILHRFSVHENQN